MTEDKNKDDSLDDMLAVYSLDDEHIEELGKILSIEYSRDFYAVTLDGELNLKEIAKKVSNHDNPRLPNATHHKDRLLKIGLIKQEKKLQRKKGHLLNYYKGLPFILIVPKGYKEKVKESKDLKKVLAGIFKITLPAVATTAILGFVLNSYYAVPYYQTTLIQSEFFLYALYAASGLIGAKILWKFRRRLMVIKP